MGLVEIRDHQVWAEHIHGDDALKRRIIGMKAGDLIELKIAGSARAFWKKMQNNRSTGKPTHGLKPLGAARHTWAYLYRARREELVSIAEAPAKHVAPDRVPARSPVPAQ